ncbi:methyltransferase-like protein 13, partial [Tanacetum coccineum]
NSGAPEARMFKPWFPPQGIPGRRLHRRNFNERLRFKFSALQALQVMELGCGESQLCEDLYKEDITDLTFIDLSSVAVAKMHKRLFSKGLRGNHYNHCLFPIYDVEY